jgi:Zn finger protein HypA/HybF involved in hydrogenase expression
MCSVGGEIFDVEISGIEEVAEYYKCGDCDNEFRSIGTKIRCPACHSDNVSKLSNDE